MSAVAQDVDEPSGVLEDVGVAVHERHRLRHTLDLVERVQVFLCGARQCSAGVRLLLADGLDDSGFDGVPTPDTELLVARHFALAPRTLDKVKSLILGFDAVGRGSLPAVGLIEDCDEARGDVAPALSPE